MKITELTTVEAERMSILPVLARAEALLKLKSQIETVPFDAAVAEEAQRQFTALSEDAREGLGAAWDRVVCAIVLGWDLSEANIADLRAACARSAAACQPLFTD
jgi:hypothetical protein